MMITAINSANSFKAVYSVYEKYSDKQDKLCKEIETKLGDRIHHHDYLLAPGPNDSVELYCYNSKNNKTGYFWTFNDTTEPFDDKALEKLDAAHNRHLKLNMGVAAFVVLSLGALFALIGKATKFNNPNSQTELVNKVDTLKNNLAKDSLDLTKRFIK